MNHGPKVRMCFPQIVSDVWGSYSRQPAKGCLITRLKVEGLKYSINITSLNTPDPIYNGVFFGEIPSTFKGLLRTQLSPSGHSELGPRQRAPVTGTALLLRSGSLALPPAASIEWEDLPGACSFLVIHATSIYGNISYQPVIELGANSPFPRSSHHPQCVPRSNLP